VDAHRLAGTHAEGMEGPAGDSDQCGTYQSPDRAHHSGDRQRFALPE